MLLKPPYIQQRRCQPLIVAYLCCELRGICVIVKCKYSVGMSEPSTFQGLVQNTSSWNESRTFEIEHSLFKRSRFLGRMSSFVENRISDHVRTCFHIFLRSTSKSEYFHWHTPNKTLDDDPDTLFEWNRIVYVTDHVTNESTSDE